MTTRLAFASLPPGTRIVPVVLVAGINAVFVPAGCSGITTIATTGSLDSAFWPGAGALGAGVLKALLDPGHEFTFSTQARILEGDVEQSALSFDLVDPDGAATALLSARDSGVAQELGAELSATSATVTLQSNAGFPAAGVCYIGREAIAYTGKGAATLTGCTRGMYGSKGVLHAYDETRPAVVTTVPRWWMGRRCSFWLATLSADGTTLTDPTLMFLGVVGPGAQLVGSGTRWRVPVDSITEALSRKLDAPTVRLWGINHTFGSGSYIVEEVSPLSARFADWPAGAATIVSLHNDSSAPHNGGWHADWTGFIDDWNVRATTVWGAGVGRATLEQDERITVYAADAGFSAPDLAVAAAWHTPVFGFGRAVGSGGASIWRSASPAPEAFVPLTGIVKIPSAVDFAKIPTTLYYPSATGGASARYSLTGKVGDKEVSCVVSGRIAGTQQIYWQADAEDTHVVEGNINRWIPPVALAPLTMKLSVTVSGDRWDAAMKLLATTLDLRGGADYHYDSVDWTAVAAALDASNSPLPSRCRVTMGEGEDTYLSLLAQFARLSGMALCMRYGRLSVYRPGDLSSTELSSRSVAATDLVQPVEVVDAEQALATSVRFELPDGDVIEHVDTSFVDLYGAGDSITVRVASGLEATPADLDAGLRRIAWAILYPLGQPWRTITLHLPLPWIDVQAGDVLSVTHPVVPSFTGTRGITSALAQVQSVELRTFGGRARAVVKARLSEGSLKGWAPEALVAAGGLADGDPHVLLSTLSGWGPYGFGQPAASSSSDGGAANFSIGDKVELWEVDDATPDSQTGFTILEITGNDIKLDGNANAVMAGHAAAERKVMLRFADYDTSTGTGQHDYAFVADSAFGLGAAPDAPHRWGG